MVIDVPLRRGSGGIQCACLEYRKVLAVPSMGFFPEILSVELSFRSAHRASERNFQGVQSLSVPLGGTKFLWGPCPSPLDHNFIPSLYPRVYKL